MKHAILISLLTLPLMAADQPATDSALKATLDQVNATGASLMPVSADGQTYRFTALNVAKEFVDAGLAPLAPMAAKISSLDLAKTKITDAGLKTLAGFKNLKELHLEGTSISDAGLEHLKGLTSLEYLNLYNTKVTDAGISKLTGLTKLKSLYLWQTGVTKSGVASLKSKLSGAHINTGWSTEDDAKPVATTTAPLASEAKTAAAPKKAAAATVAGGKLDPTIAAKAIIYKDVIAPIMQAKCVSCHGAEKKKGKLQLHEFAAIMKGGGDGATTVIPKNIKDSLMLTRINLASDDDEHMPPSDEPQVTKEELAVLKWWIETGASDSATVSAAKPTPEVEAALAFMLGKGIAKTTVPTTAPKVEKPKPKPLSDAEKKQVAVISAKMQSLNASLMPLAQDTEQLRLSVINAADKFGDQQLAMLEPIAAHIIWVDLARSQITDAASRTLAKLVNIERLHLENTKISDAVLAGLGSLKALEYLNLYGTNITDAGLTKLAGIKSLKKVFVWQTGVTRAAATALEGQIPGLKVNVGLSEAEIAKLTTPPPAPPTAPAKKAEPEKAAATKTPATPTVKPASAPAPPAKPEVKPAPAVK